MAKPRHRKLRKEIIETCRAMNRLGINQGTSGNVSARLPAKEEGFLITPSGLSYDDMLSEHIVEMDLEGRYTGDCLPSSEWRMHLAIYRERPDAGAVVHSHPTYGTALACLNWTIPAFHYMIAVAGGTNIRCAGYATFGTEELAREMLDALDGRDACLLANHGTICLGRSVERALWLAVEVESLARQYWHARMAGEPVILSDDEMRRVLARFDSYGKQNRQAAADGGALPGDPPPRAAGEA